MNGTADRAVLSIATDITERKRADAALRESERRIQSVFRSAPIGIGVVSNRLVKQVNRRLCEMTGYGPEELIERDSRMLYPSDEEYEFVGREKYIQIREHGTGTVETRWQRKDGAPIHVLLSSTPIELEDLSKGVTFTALDITERKRTEEALKQERRAVPLAAEPSPHGIRPGLLAERDDLLLERRFSYPLWVQCRGGPSGRTVWIWSSRRNCGTISNRPCAPWTETGEPAPASELELRRKDGSLVQVYSAYCILRRPGVPQEVYSVDIDLSEIKARSPGTRKTPGAVDTSPENGVGGAVGRRSCPRTSTTCWG